MSDKAAEWVGRVLGVQVGNTGADRELAVEFDAHAWSAARDAWDDAIATVDRQIGQLQSALRASDDPELKKIGEFGLNSMTGRRRVALTAALLQVGDGKGAPIALKAIRGMRTFLQQDEVVEACDRNPFGVAVSIRGTLGPALEAMEKALGG